MILGGCDSPLGPLTLIGEGGRIVALRWQQSPPASDPLLRDGAEQLAAYFAGDRRTFDLPLGPDVSKAAGRVLAAMARLPHGETRSYGEVARETGLSAQAVGQACGANPLPILIPCHRIVGAQSLGGYSGAGGIETKVWLLKHEGAASLLL